MPRAAKRLSQHAVDGLTALFTARSRRASSRLVSSATLRDTEAQRRYKRGSVRQDFEVDADHVLGSGFSGEVVAARCRRTGTQVAVKSYSKNGMSSRGEASLRAEVNIYLAVHHPHIATLLAVYESEDDLSFVMECCTGGELFNRLAKKHHFTEAEAVQTARQMCSAIEHLHQLGVVHRDLKLENWLYESEAENAPLKLIDFGFALQWNRKKPMTAVVGTVDYLAPEVFLESYSEKCDMWSLGVLVYALLVGKQPFKAGSEEELIEQIKLAQWSFPKEGETTVIQSQHRISTGSATGDISKSAQDFVQKLLTPHASERTSAKQCLQHPWLHTGRGQPTTELPRVGLSPPRRVQNLPQWVSPFCSSLEDCPSPKQFMLPSAAEPFGADYLQSPTYVTTI